MVTIRRYFNLAEAAFAKSLLDDYEISCALWDENAFLYGRAPFAMPIRLMVGDDYVAQAIQILIGNAEAIGEIESAREVAAATEGEESKGSSKTNPWELLAMAFPFFVPALCWFQLTSPVGKETGARSRYLLAKLTVAHFLAVLCLLFAASLVAAYFRVRAEMMSSQPDLAEPLEN